MTGRDARASRQDGFTIVEVMVAATVIIVGMLGVLTMLDTANDTSARTKAREGAVNLAREAIEAVRAVPYPDLLEAGGQAEAELKAQPGLADVDAAAGWQVRRRNITYTVAVSVCSVDDGTVEADGFGNHTGVAFCPESTATGTTDNNPDDYKRVTLDVTWQDGARTRTARQEAVINNPGSAFAPAIKTLTPSVASPVTSTVSSITFGATTSSRAQEVKWTLDNVQQLPATATNSGKTSWTFSWDTSPSVVDGTYLVGAEAYDQFGQAGTGRVVTMQLNRYQPAAPTGFAGGRNPLWTSTFAEFEWNPNPERDVVGYRVYEKRTLSADRLVCERFVEEASPTTCQDTQVPSSLLGLTYYVVALAPARVGSGLEQSEPTAITVGDATPPGPPTGITLERTVDGTTLRWSPPADSDIRYYRIYRDDISSWEKRLDRTGSAADLAVTDPNATTSDPTHCYWLTSVDDDFAESPPAPTGGICS